MIERHGSPAVAARRYRRGWGCPLTRNRSNRCYALCAPREGTGFCGRVAPHSLSGRTADAIRSHGALRWTVTA